MGGSPRRAARSSVARAAVIVAAAGAGWLAAAGAQPLLVQGAEPPALPKATADETDPAAPKPGAQAGAEGSEEDAERAAMRERLLRRIAETDSRVQLLTQAVAKLDEGKSVEEVRGFIRERGAQLARLLAGSEAHKEIERFDGRPGRDEGGRWRGGPHEGGDGGDGPRGNPWRERARDGRPLTEEERGVLRDMLAATEPSALSEFEALRRQNPEEAEERMRRLLPVAGVMIELRRRDPALYRLRLEQMKWERQVFSLVREIVEVEGAPTENAAQLASLRTKLAEAGGRAFDMRIAVQAHELGKLQEQLDTLRKDITEQGAKRESLITTHTDRLLNAARQRKSDDLNGGPRHDLEGRPMPMGRPRLLDDGGPPDGPRRRPARREGPTK